MYCADISPNLFIENRKRLAQKIKPSSLLVLHSNLSYPLNADMETVFVQQTDIFYLTGIAQKDTVLLMYKNREAEVEERICTSISHAESTLWEGEKYSKEQIFALSGIKRVYGTEVFKKIFHNWAIYADHIYLNTNEHLRAEPSVLTKDAHFIQWCKKHYPLHRYERVAPLLHQLRAIKSHQEVELIQKAVEISGNTFHKILQFVKPGIWEYEIEAELYHSFISQKAQGPAYSLIIASGKNSCVLHYTKNNQQCQSGDVLLMDFGAKYTHYNADISRTIPINGKFTTRQKQIYNAVLKVQKKAISLLEIGNTLEAYHKEVGDIMEAELLEIGLIKKHELEKQNPQYPLYKKYFMHGTSHHLGLDVHDYGQDEKRKFEKGMLFTCEPGIYIPEENLGVRLENNLLITETTPIDLSKNIPIEVEEIETIMNA